MNETSEVRDEYHEEALRLRETNLALREEVVALRENAIADAANRSRPIILNGRLIEFGSRKAVAEMFGLTPDTVSDLVSEGVLPPPCDLTAVRNPGATNSSGRRILLWDLYEVAEWALRKRNAAHPALVHPSAVLRRPSQIPAGAADKSR